MAAAVEVDAAGVGTSGTAEEVVEVPATLPDPEDVATEPGNAVPPLGDAILRAILTDTTQSKANAL